MIDIVAIFEPIDRRFVNDTRLFTQYKYQNGFFSGHNRCVTVFKQTVTFC